MERSPASVGNCPVDPKGVVGEIEFEVGASLRNPREAPLLFTSRKTIERRIRQLSDTLAFDAARVTRWAFAQAVLSAIWAIEDGARVEKGDPSIVLAETLRRLLVS